MKNTGVMDIKGNIHMVQHKQSIAKKFILQPFTSAVQLDYTADTLVDTFLHISSHPRSFSQWNHVCHRGART